ncbi:hypothetical protein SOVF_172150, partial [Spinacia oleracea]
IDPVKYKSISSGFGIFLKEQGARNFFRGWVPTLLGCSAQGACKFGFYEFFKKYYADIAGPEYAAKYKTLIYLAGSVSAELIADIALFPMEKYYADIAGPEYAAKYKTLIYLAGSVSAELIADIALFPMEVVKVRLQTQPGFARGLSDGLPKFIKSGGIGGCGGVEKARG